MNQLSRICGIKQLALVIGSVLVAGCGAEAQGEANEVPLAPNTTPKAPQCQIGPSPPICNLPPPCYPGSTSSLCNGTPPPLTLVYVDSQGDLKIEGSSAANTIGVSEPVMFTLEINDPNLNLAVSSGCWHHDGNPRIVRCGVPWYSRMIVNLYGGNDIFWSTIPRQAFVNGGSGADTIVTRSAEDLLYGGPGVDDIWGGPGNDWILGAEDNDTLHGGLGNDMLEGNDGSDTTDGEGGSDSCIAETRTNCES